MHKSKALEEKWEAFRRDTITSIVREVARRVRAEAPGVKIRADVFRRAHGDALTVAQDWESWCREGLLDTVSPMDGGPADELRPKLASQIAPAGGASRMVPTYYPSLWRQTTNAEDIMNAIRVGREVGVAGFCLFRFDGRLIEMLALDKGETGGKK